MTCTSAGLLAALLLAEPAAAEGFRERLAVELRGGVASPVHDDLRAFDRGPSVEVAAVYRAHRHVALALSAGWLQVETTPVSVGIGDAPDATTARLVVRQRILPVLLEARAVLPLGRLEVHGMAAAGVATSFYDDTLWRKDASRDTSLAWQAGAGGALALGERLAVTVDARYFGASGSYEDRPQRIVLQTPRRMHLEVVAASVGVRWRL